MKLATLEIASIDRVIAHEIHPKTMEKDAFAKTNSSLLKFRKLEKEILIKRILEALTSTTKTFQLDYEDKSTDSVYSLMTKVKKQTDKEFIVSSASLAEELAYAHFRTKIPGGYCLIGNGLTKNNEFFFFVIKAELQEVFNVHNNELTLIKDVFLSPAKDFYKIGFFLESGSNFIPFMYDDQFSLQKKDLTEYFYGTFLGLTTDRNDKLKSKNFYEDTKSFIETNIDDVHDRIGLLKALNVLYRENTTGLISAREFSDNYFEGELKTKFEKKIVEEKYPISFTKDISLVENRLELQRISIPLSYSMSIVGSTSELDTLDIINDPSKQTMKDIEPQINNGQIRKMILVKQAT
jgi:hypothetical protein